MKGFDDFEVVGLGDFVLVEGEELGFWVFGFWGLVGLFWGCLGSSF